MVWTPRYTGTLTFPLWCEDPELQTVPNARTPPTSSSAGQAAWLAVFLPPQQRARRRTCFPPEAPSQESQYEQSLRAGCTAACKVMSQTGIITSRYKCGRGGPGRKARGRKENLERCSGLKSCAFLPPRPTSATMWVLESWGCSGSDLHAPTQALGTITCSLLFTN